METNHFAIYNGKIVYVPEVPDGADYVNQADDGGHYDAKGYEQALQFSIAAGIEVENQDEVEGKLLVIHEHHNGFKLQSGKLYPLQCRVEIVQICETNGDACPIYDSILHKKVARVTFEQPEKKDDAFVLAHKKKEPLSKRLHKVSEKIKLIKDTKDEQPEAAGQEQEKAIKEFIRWSYKTGNTAEGEAYCDRIYQKFLTRKP